MKAVLRKALNRFGFDVVRLRNSNQTLATNLMNVVERYAIECIFDVGANSGQYGLFLRQIGYRGKILSFEPVHSVFEKLKATASGDSDWHCYRYALGDKDETREINVYKSTVFSSFLRANEYSKERWASLNDVDVEQVEVRQLASLFPELMKLVGNVPCLLKMDTQGFDVNVFMGARGILDRVVALQSEIGMIGIYEGMGDSLETLRLFREHGYDVSGMFPINRDDSLAVIEFDCLLVRRQPLAQTA